MAEAKCIAGLVHLVDHDYTELVNMDDFSLKISDQLNCQLLVNLADHSSLLEHILILTLDIAINKSCHISWHYFGQDKVLALIVD